MRQVDRQKRSEGGNENSDRENRQDKHLLIKPAHEICMAVISYWLRALTQEEI